MRVSITLPQDAVPDENPHRTAELSSVPRVGDLIGYDDVDNCLEVKQVIWDISVTELFTDIGDRPSIICDWYYVED